MTRFLLLLSLLSLACGSTIPRRQLELYPSPTANPTQTERIVVWTQTPNATTAPKLMIISVTPNINTFCVNATIAVWLRPSPSTDNYPIAPLPNGTHVTALGGQAGDWLFVEFGDKRGWVNKAYLAECS